MKKPVTNYRITFEGNGDISKLEAELWDFLSAHRLRFHENSRSERRGDRSITVNHNDKGEVCIRRSKGSRYYRTSRIRGVEPAGNEPEERDVNRHSEEVVIDYHNTTYRIRVYLPL